jgi:hypothetical protein
MKTNKKGELNTGFYIIISLIGVIAISCFVILLSALLTGKCIEYEDVCYKTVCVKTCWDVPTSCSDDRVIGHKEMCVVSKNIFGTINRRKI